MAARHVFWKTIICSILADRLSRSGSHRVFSAIGPSSQWSLAMYNPRPDFSKQILNGGGAFETPNIPSINLTTLHAKMEITGFAYKAPLAGYLSMSIMLIHMVIALSHLTWVIRTRRTSRSWNSISELIALSQNSQPAIDSLANTGGGLHCSETFARLAKIRVRRQSRNPYLDHVELVLEGPAGSTHTAGSDSSAISASSRSSSRLGDPGMVHRVRGSWTFPLDRGRPFLQRDEDLEGRIHERDGLMPKPDLENGEREDRVRVNRAYS